MTLQLIRLIALQFLSLVAPFVPAQVATNFDGNIILGRPTDRSVTFNVLFNADQESSRSSMVGLSAGERFASARSLRPSSQLTVVGVVIRSVRYCVIAPISSLRSSRWLITIPPGNSSLVVRSIPDRVMTSSFLFSMEPDSDAIPGSAR